MTKQTCASKSKVALNAAFAAILAVGLSVPAASAFAAPSDDKQAEAQAALQKLNQYQSELDQASANYEAAHQEQIDAQNRVDEAQKQIEEKTAQIEKDQQRLSDRARDMYRSGDTNFLDVILGASSFEQFATTWNIDVYKRQVDGLGLSAWIFVVTLVGSLPLGIVVALCRMSSFKPLSLLAQFYISILRGTPLMLQLMAFMFGPYYLLGMNMGTDWKFGACAVGFILNYSAYFAAVSYTHLLTSIYRIRL